MAHRCVLVQDGWGGHAEVAAVKGDHRPPGPSQPRWRQAARRRRRGGERSRDHIEGKVAASRPRTDGAGLQMELPVFKLTD